MALLLVQLNSQNRAAFLWLLMCLTHCCVLNQAAFASLLTGAVMRWRVEGGTLEGLRLLDKKVDAVVGPEDMQKCLCGFSCWGPRCAPSHLYYGAATTWPAPAWLAASELQLVGGKGCVCGGCKVARYYPLSKRDGRGCAALASGMSGQYVSVCTHRAPQDPGYRKWMCGCLLLHSQAKSGDSSRNWNEDGKVQALQDMPVWQKR
jgi:hypothetical protein